MPDVPSVPQSDPQPAGKRRRMAEMLLTLLAAAMASLLLQQFAFAQTEVRNISMQTTLTEGERLVENKLAYVFGNPRRGDIVIIYGPESPLRLVKRVIGLPGDRLDFRDGSVYLNEAELTEPYAEGATFPEGLRLPYTVPEGTVFVMGDNREHSEDSRELGPIRRSSLEGKIVFRLWPLGKAGPLD